MPQEEFKSAYLYLSRYLSTRYLCSTNGKLKENPARNHFDSPLFPIIPGCLKVGCGLTL